MPEDQDDFTLEAFLTDPKHAKRRDILFGVVDSRLKDIIEQRFKEREKDATPAKPKSGASFAEYFDWLFPAKADK